MKPVLFSYVEIEVQYNLQFLSYVVTTTYVNDRTDHGRRGIIILTDNLL